MQETASSFQGSPQQDEQWRREPDGPTGRVQAVVTLDGPLDPQALKAALQAAVQRHEILRTTFAHQPGIRIPLQAINDELEPSFQTSDAAATDAAAALEDALESDRTRRLDFERGPLVHARLIRLADERHVLVLTVPTVCVDPSSMALLVAELAQGCGADGGLVEEPLQYADFSAWQHELAESDADEARAAREYWQALSEASSPGLPFATAAARSQRLEHVAVELDAPASTVILHAAWHALLGRVSGDVDLVVPFLSPDRRHPDLDGAVGAFARPVPVATTIDLEAPLQTLVEEIESARSRAPELEDYAPPESSQTLTIGFCEYPGYRGRAGEVEISLDRILDSGRAWSLWLTCARDAEQPAAWISFDPGAHDRGAVERLARELARLISDAAARPSAPVAELELLDAAERALVLAGFNDTASAAPAAPLHERFASHASSSPEREAVRDERGALSYGELDARANQLANRLRAAGIGSGDTVGLCTDRSVEMVVGLLGILKAGGAYVPLNYEHPAARLGQQLQRAGARAIVTQEALLVQLPAWDGELICLDRAADRVALDAEPVTAPDLASDPGDLAYVIYTSGSTGEPKGVAVTHGNLANYAADITRRLGADSGQLTFALITSISTDLGNTSLVGALASGGSLVLVSPTAAADPAAVARQFEATGVDVLKITPSHIGALLAGGDPRVLPRRTLVIGGERAPWDLVDRVRALSDCAILNHYGPTEATIGCCTFAVESGPGPFAPSSVPIGRPITNARCYVLDRYLRPVPIGVPGTLHIGGAGIARGYVGQPELTAERFLVDPFAEGGAGRMYDTGDVVRWLPDGSLEFLGRVDEQVKIRGYRVEPGEVEAALRAHPNVSEAVVVTAEAASGEHRLIAYYTASSATTEDELRSHLAEMLPDFMVPSAFVPIAAVPRTPSGKVDRLSLPEPPSGSETASSEYVAPQSPTEQAVAAIWSRTLGIERIGLHDDFFDLGGHSLLATQIVAQVRSDLAVELPLHTLFMAPTVELFAAEVVQLMGASDGAETERLLAELEGLSPEEVERLLADETGMDAS